ncbi:MAG: methionine gamma-lyase [Firmicutes bacterium]|nr:methionine gamma-lyase [Bacillota bacterium]MDD3298482.1 methionine gamma-lyase [Bacillota bacterium]MDD3851245.1 methionine gamma-lyase [Bacillota bacterium]MDD4707081.1 methionine gamma-lyase [Bacillota bacterium]
MDIKKLKKGTKAIFSEPCPLTGSHVRPIYQTSTFIFENVDQGARRFAGEEEGYIYTRLGNPTVTDFEKKIALLEGGEAAAAFGSGMGAITASIMALVSAGDHIVSAKTLYGCTHAFLSHLITRFGVETTFVDATDVKNIEAAIRPNTKVVYVESPANPNMALVDITAVAQVAHKHGAKVIVDNTFMTPYWQRPLELGCDVVVHSATKYIGGHGLVVAGVTVGAKDFIDEVKVTTLKDIGAVISPFDAWLLTIGLKTLGVRMEKHETNAMMVAKWLEENPKVDKVYYPGLASHPQYALAKKQAEGFGAMIAFELKGGMDAGVTLMNSVEMIHLAVSLGNVDSLIQHPASMTHSPYTEEERLAAGISDGLVRLSVGIEEPEDILADLEQAFAKIK